MKNKLQKGLVVFALIGLTFSCVTSNEVAGNRGIQKRKYTKGFYFDNKGKIGGGLEENNIAKNEPKTENTSVVAEEFVAPSIELTTTYNAENAVIAPVVNEAAVITETSETSNPSFSNSTNEVKENLKNDKKVLGTKKVNSIDEELNLITPKKATQSNFEVSDDAILYYVLAILIPFLAVGLVTDWDLTKVIICLLLCVLFWLPGMIYALIVVHNNV